MCVCPACLILAVLSCSSILTSSQWWLGFDSVLLASSASSSSKPLECWLFPLGLLGPVPRGHSHLKLPAVWMGWPSWQRSAAVLPLVAWQRSTPPIFCSQSWRSTLLKLCLLLLSHKDRKRMKHQSVPGELQRKNIFHFGQVAIGKSFRLNIETDTGRWVAFLEQAFLLAEKCPPFANNQHHSAWQGWRSLGQAADRFHLLLKLRGFVQEHWKRD